MKRLLFLITALGLLFSAYAQEIKVKKGIVYQDETPIMKMDGKCGVFTKLKYSFLSVNGDTLFKMKDCELGYTDPRNAPLLWHELEFKNKKVALKKESTFTNDKQVAKFLLSLKPVFVKDNAIDTAALAQFITNNDYTKFIVSDTSSCFEFERKQKQQLDATSWKRDMKKEFVIKRLTGDTYNLVGFQDYNVIEVHQDNVLIGVVVEKHMRYMQNEYNDYYFLKRLNQAIDHKGVKHAFGMLAYVQGSSVRRLNYVYEKGKPMFSLKETTQNPVLDITMELLQTGCLE